MISFLEDLYFATTTKCEIRTTPWSSIPIISETTRVLKKEIPSHYETSVTDLEPLAISSEAAPQYKGGCDDLATITLDINQAQAIASRPPTAPQQAVCRGTGRLHL